MATIRLRDMPRIKPTKDEYYARRMEMKKRWLEVAEQLAKQDELNSVLPPELFDMSK